MKLSHSWGNANGGIKNNSDVSLLLRNGLLSNF